MLSAHEGNDRDTGKAIAEPHANIYALTFYVQPIANEGELRRCDIATSSYRGACVAVKPRERFCLPN